MAQKLSEKYIAGFLDADGSIQIAWRKVDRLDTDPALRRAYLSIEFTQATSQDEVLYRIGEAIGCGRVESDGRYSRLRLFGKQAAMLLSRIRKYLVLKRHIAAVSLDMTGQVFDVKQAKKRLKMERKIRSLPLPNYPSRKWLAGYFDGDGSFQARLPKGRSSVQIVAQITTAAFDSEGVEILHKAFGGSLTTHNKGGTDLTTWVLTMPPSKATEFIGHFAKELVVKREQAYLILGCAKMGNYRDGRNIKLALKQLKAQPHRLNEPRLSESVLLKRIDGSIETRQERGARMFAESGGCLVCGENAHYSDALCRKCYDAKRKAA